jgi:hypothetical protein
LLFGAAAPAPARIAAATASSASFSPNARTDNGAFDIRTHQLQGLAAPQSGAHPAPWHGGSAAQLRFASTLGPAGVFDVNPITGTPRTVARLDSFLTKVLFNGVSATFTVNSYSQITATVPAGATTGPITVVTAGRKGVVSKTSFTVT